MKLFSHKLGIRTGTFLDGLLSRGERFVPYTYACGHEIFTREKPSDRTEDALRLALTRKCLLCKAKVAK